MRILHIEIESFGKLNDLSLEPAAGLTLIEGENESGKSTILAFLRFCFYGFPRKNAPDGDEREKRISWQTHTAAGRLTLEWQGGTYRIARRCVCRTTGARESVSEELSVIALPDGGEVALSGKAPGEYFLGLPAELYDGSLSLLQSGADRVIADGMGDAVGNLLFAGEAVLSAEMAESKLQTARRDLLHVKGRGGRVAELEDELSALDSALVGAREERARLEALRLDMAHYRGQIAEKRRELTRVAGAFEGAELDRTLSLFDDLRQARVEEQRCREALEQIGSQGALEMPDRELVTRMATALEELTAAEAEEARLTPELGRLLQVRHNEKLLQGASSMEKLGDAVESLPGRVAKQQKKAKGACIAGLLLLLLTAAALVAAYLLPAYRIWCGLGGGLAAALALACLAAGAIYHRKGKKMLASVGARDITMFRTYLEQCRREAASYQAHWLQEKEVRERLSDVQMQCQRAKACLQKAFDDMGHPEIAVSVENVRAYLTYLSRRKGELQSALSDATIAVERAVSARETLARRVEGMDEGALRARRAALSWGETDVETLRNRRAFLEEALTGLEQKCAAAERAESALVAVAKDPDELMRRRHVAETELREANHRLAAIRMALEGLTLAADEMRRQVTPRLSERATSLFHELTDGAHEGALRIAPDLSMTLEGEGIPRPLSQFSAGCRDAAYLSLRLALLETVTGERLPLFFDEALSRLDDRRAENLLRVLERYVQSGGQCLLFTCHTREASMLSGQDVLRLHL